MKHTRLLFTALLALPLLAFGAATSSAEMLSWIRLDGVCYGYHPRDPRHCLGKYYPYSGEYCRRARAKRHVAKVALRPAKASYCSKTASRKHKSRCPVFKF
jgi:hypothetical protein